MTADLAAEALFGESSQLYLRLYEEGLIDSSFGGGFEVIDGCSMLMVSGDSRDPEAVRDAILEEARRLAETGISGEDFRRMTRSALGRRVKGLDSFDSTCFRLTAYHMTGFDYFDFPRIQEDLSAEDLREFLDTAVRRENCSLSVIYPKEESYESD
jgi:predicted Zn-dependent peptidase